MALDMAQNWACDASSVIKAPSTLPSMSGWLLKRKSEGARSRLISGTNRRYFTLDFNTQVFFYSHSEDTKQVSYPVAFRDILGVETLAQAAEEEAPVVRTNSKISLASKVFGSKPAKEQHGFLLRTPGKSLELLCASAEESERWVSALTTACAVGQGAPLPGQGGSEPTGERSTTPGSLASGQLQNEDGLNLMELDQHEQDEPVGEPAGLLAPRPLAQAAALQDTQEIPPQAMTMMSLSSEMEKQGWAPQDALAPAPPPRPSRAEPEVLAEIVPERVQEADDIGAVSPRGQEGSCSAWGAAAAPAGPSAAVKYSDRGEGLTLQQRLAQLDFSDDEDEADEPAPLGSAEPLPTTAGDPVEHRPPQAGAPVEHEACQAFVAPESDNED